MSELSINFYDGLVRSGDWIASYQQVESYHHEIRAVGGYWAATFSLRVNMTMIDRWLENGIGGHIIAYNRIKPVWEGIVNEIQIEHGGLVLRYGPLLDIGNRVSVSYSGVDLSTTIPTVGTQVVTDEADNEDSQDLFGIIPKVVTANEISADDAEQIRDTFLQENAYPATSRDWSSSAGQEPSVTVACVGYSQMLVYPYNQTTYVGQQNASDKIEDILDADPNSLFDTTYLDTNTVQVPRYEYQDTIAWPMIEKIVSRGGTTNERWLFGVYDNQEAWYEAAPTDLEYWLRLSDPGQRISSATEGRVPFAEVRPGKWLLFSDFLVGRGHITGDPREDPRAMFIESVTFDAPNMLKLVGGSTNTLAQLLAKDTL